MLFRTTILAILFSLCTASIHSQSYTVDSFFIKVNVTERGQLEVEERLSVNFVKESRGIIRAIPFLSDFDGVQHRTPILDINVPTHKFHVSDIQHEKRIRIGDALTYMTGPQEYVILYTVDKTVIQYDEHEEVFWNLTGNSWDTPLRNVAFNVQLPKAVDLASKDIGLWLGNYGESDNDVFHEYSERELRGEVTRNLKAGEGVTVALKLPRGYFDGIPDYAQVKAEGEERRSRRGGGFTIDAEKNKWWFFGFPLALFGLVWSWWSKKRNVNKGVADIETKSYPPEGLTSAHVGAYVDHKVHKRDVISLIPYWATEGFIKIRGLDNDDMQLVKLKDLPSEFPAYEHQFFNAIFKSSEVITFSDAQHQYGTVYYKVAAKLTKEIENAGYYDARYVYWFKTWRWPMMCLSLMVLGGLTVFSSPYVFIGLGIALVGVVCFCFSFFTAPLSDFGQQVHDHLIGLADFLKSGNEDEIARLNAEDPNYFSHMLPYAVAFGYDEQWLKTYEKISTRAPSWYESAHMGAWMIPNFSVFRRSFKTAEMTKAFTTLPKIEASSSGSAFGGGGGGFSSGGGFSGGGFGGGGGSSW